MFRSGHVQLVAFLAQQNASLSIQDNQGYNPLHLAVHGSQPFMVLLLLGLKMHVDSLDFYKRTPLMWACYSGSSIESIQVLLSWDPDLDLRDTTGYTALHWAVISAHYHAGKYLVDAGADLNIRDENGKTPYDWAKERGQEEQYSYMVLDHQPLSKKETISRNVRILKINSLRKDRQGWIMYGIPFVTVPFCIWVLATFSALYTIPSLCLFLFALSKVIQIFLANNDQQRLMNSPIVSAVLQSTLLYVFFTWVRIFRGARFPPHFTL